MQRRAQQAWPKEREFKILSIDGGGIKGIFPAALLAEIEDRYLDGHTVADHFDLITGTSTGGIIALGLSIGMPARKIADLYTEHGGEIFPSPRLGWLGRNWQCWRNLASHRYEHTALEALLSRTFEDRKLGDAKSRLCIPSCDGRFGDVYVFKTPHHHDFKKDRHELMTTVAMATAAAPTYFRPLDFGGYRFVDGGLWANNPIMVGIVDALSCFDVDRHQVRVLSLGCGDEPFTVSDSMAKWGGLLSWKKVINGAIAYQSQNVLGQAGLLLGAERILRISPRVEEPPIELDDWNRAKDELPVAALSSFEIHGEAIREAFLGWRQ